MKNLKHTARKFTPRSRDRIGDAVEDLAAFMDPLTETPEERELVNHLRSLGARASAIEGERDMAGEQIGRVNAIAAEQSDRITRLTGRVRIAWTIAAVWFLAAGCLLWLSRV